MKKKFYITSPIFYPNANLHMGHAYSMTIIDMMARYHRLIDVPTYFLTGADENTSKVIKAAEEKGISVEKYLEDISDSFKRLFKNLNISYDQFIRTSDKEIHWRGAQLLWSKLVEAGDIEKRSYSGLYCIGCEAFYTEKDLMNGKCPIHETPVEVVREDNYFFKLSKYTDIIKEKIKNNELKIIPDTRKNEILALLERGLEDVSFSRPAKTIPWGIPVPGDDSQNIYVWCDALSNYITALGYGREDDENFKNFWPADYHVIGKDILRFHAAIWPAMLLSAGLPLPKSIMVHGLITSGGRKMSKSLGNVIDPEKLLAEYGADALRYYFAREISPFEDGDLTEEKFKEAYNANLANGIGNLTSRILKMAETYGVTLDEEERKLTYFDGSRGHDENMDRFDIKAFADLQWNHIKLLDEYIQKEEPYKKIKNDPETAKKDVHYLLIHLLGIALKLEPLLPETSDKLQKIIKDGKMPERPLFERKN
jgi:methionyl-tRNA synthetase